MSRSLSTAAHFVAAIAEAANLATSRRGFAAASVTAMRAGAAKEKVAAPTMSKTPVEGLADSSSASWVPDPVTGYYRPANSGDEVDPAELREMLLLNRSRT